jgi:plasmid stabilization system protein ParE
LRPLKIVDLAEDELREATEYYRQRDPRVAAQFVAETRKTLHLMEQFPGIGAR